MDEFYNQQTLIRPSKSLTQRSIKLRMLTMGLTGKMLTNFVGDGRLTKFGVRFTNQVWPGDTLTSTATVTELREEDGDKLVDLEVKTTNQDGTTVVSGYATAKVDP